MDFPWIRVGPLPSSVTSWLKRSSSVIWEREEEDDDGDEQAVGDLTGDTTRDRDVRAMTGGGDLTGDLLLPFVADMVSGDGRFSGRRTGTRDQETRDGDSQQPGCRHGFSGSPCDP